MSHMGPMRLMGLIGLMRLMGLMGLMGLIGLMSSCQSDETPTPALSEVEITSYVAGFEENSTATRGSYEAYEAYGAYEAYEPNGANEPYGAYGAYRAYGAYGVPGMKHAWAVPSGYTAYEDGDKTIGINFTKDGEAPLSGHFFKSSGKWRTNLELANAGTYYLYGYIPHTSGISCSVTDRNGTQAHFSEGAILTLENVPAILPNDLCVVIGAKDGTDKETVTGLRSGDFAYAAKAIKGTGDEDPQGNFVFLLFDHLYAALRIRMRVNGEYNALRTIKLKKLQLQTKVGDDHVQEKTRIDITLKATDGSDPSESPITDISFTPSGPEITEGIEFWSSSDEVLTTSYSSYIGHFMPLDVTQLILVSTYDVYDKKGNLLRENCKAKNTFELKELFSEQLTTRRGCRYTINLTIKPTYLYVLSEPDLQNPTVEIES